MSDKIFKRFKMPNGEPDLELTKEEFYRVVDIFKMLMEQQTKLIIEGRWRPDLSNPILPSRESSNISSSGENTTESAKF